MSNETDLDWLARNVHVWPTNTPKAILPGDATFKLGAVFYGDCVAFSGELEPEYRRVNKADWLARRAELQNKPSWSKAEEWAGWLAQDSYGCWGFFQKKPLMHALSWIARSGYYQIHSPGNLLLGDWRDTLEKRPEEFQPFTSVEDNQEKAIKQDNGWHERGELPPVGTVCEVLWNEGRMEYLRTKVFGVNEHGQPIHRFDEGPKKFEYQADPLVTILGTRVFRPIRTERDVLLSVIVEEMNHYDTDGKLADAILAAGFSLGAK